MSLDYRVGELLGLEIETEAEMQQAIRDGDLPSSALIRLVRHLSGSNRGPATTAMAQRIVSRATWSRALKNPRSKLSKDVADRVERVGALVAHAERVWGDLGDAREFVISNQVILGGAPLDLAADSTVGARRAESLLARVEHGLAV